MRKERDALTDPKYEGKRISRNQLYADDSANEHEEDSGNESGGRRPVTSEEGEDDEDDVGQGSDESEAAWNDEHSAPENRPEDQGRSTSSARTGLSEHLPPTTEAEPNNGELSSTLRRAREEERKKGKAVSRQMVCPFHAVYYLILTAVSLVKAIFDSLLDARIRLQKCVASMNRLPDSVQVPNYMLEDESRAAADRVLEESLGLADDLFDLQEKLMSSNEVANPPMRKRRRIDVSPADRDWDEELNEYSNHYADLDAVYVLPLIVVLFT